MARTPAEQGGQLETRLREIGFLMELGEQIGPSQVDEAARRER